MERDSHSPARTSRFARSFPLGMSMSWTSGPCSLRVLEPPSVRSPCETRGRRSGAGWRVKPLTGGRNGKGSGTGLDSLRAEVLF